MSLAPYWHNHLVFDLLSQYFLLSSLGINMVNLLMPGEDNRKNSDSTLDTSWGEYYTKDINCLQVPIWHKIVQRLVSYDPEVKLLMYNLQKLCPLGITWYLHCMCFIAKCNLATPSLWRCLCRNGKCHCVIIWPLTSYIPYWHYVVRCHLGTTWRYLMCHIGATWLGTISAPYGFWCLKVRPHYAVRQSATHCSFATRQNLLGICRQCNRVHMKK